MGKRKKHAVVQENVEEKVEEEIPEGEEEEEHQLTQTQNTWAKRLASNDLKQRTKTLRTLERHLAAPDITLTYIELMKIWKGLYYALWAADGVKVQNQLSDQLAHLIHVHPTRERTIQFLNAYYKTMDTEWGGIDDLRIDKYYYLTRQYVRQMFEYIKNNNYDESLIDECYKVIFDNLFSADADSQLCTHIVDVYIREMEKAFAQETIQPHIWVKLGIDLFIRAIKTPPLRPGLFERIREYFRELSNAALNNEDDEEFPDVSLTAFPLQECVDYLFKAASSREDIPQKHRTTLYKIHALYQEAAKKQAKQRENPEVVDEEEAEIEREAKALLQQEIDSGLLGDDPVIRRKMKQELRQKRLEERRKAMEQSEATEQGDFDGENSGEPVKKAEKKKRPNKKRKAAVEEEVRTEPTQFDDSQINGDEGVNGSNDMEIPHPAAEGKKKKNKRKNKKQKIVQHAEEQNILNGTHDQSGDVNGSGEQYGEQNGDQYGDVDVSGNQGDEVSGDFGIDSGDNIAEEAPVEEERPTKKLNLKKTKNQAQQKLAAQKKTKKPRLVQITQEEQNGVEPDQTPFEEAPAEPEPAAPKPAKKSAKTKVNGKIPKLRNPKPTTDSTTTTSNTTQDTTTTLTTPTSTPHKQHHTTPKSLLKTPNASNSTKKNVRFSVENSVKEFFKESAVIPTLSFLE